jgi:hypothetical protein
MKDFLLISGTVQELHVTQGDTKTLHSMSEVKI